MVNVHEWEKAKLRKTAQKTKAVGVESLPAATATVADAVAVGWITPTEAQIMVDVDNRLEARKATKAANKKLAKTARKIASADALLDEQLKTETEAMDVRAAVRELIRNLRFENPAARQDREDSLTRSALARMRSTGDTPAMAAKAVGYSLR